MSTGDASDYQVPRLAAIALRAGRGADQIRAAPVARCAFPDPVTWPAVPRPDAVLLRSRNRPFFLTMLLLAVLTAWSPASAQARRTERIIVVTLDGVRWQELFGGADSGLLARRGAVRDTAETRGRFWQSSADARRAALFPFPWGTFARHGQVFGDSALGAGAYVTNGLWFSYPGYNELLAGAPDPRVRSNDKLRNPNRTVLEYLNGRPCCRGKVAAWGSWDVLPFIVNAERSGISINGDGHGSQYV